MKEQGTITVPFYNKGIKQRTDVAQLGPGEYSYLLNTLTVQDGALTTRQGNRNMAPELSVSGGIFYNPGGNRLHTIAKMRLAAANTENPRYLGFGNLIYRTKPNGGGEYTAANTTSVALDSAGSAYFTTNERWQSVQYNTGALSKPSFYIASSKGNVRDDGDFTKLELWGVPRPVTPAVCSPGISTPTEIFFSTSGNTRVSVTIGTATAINVVGGAGLYRFDYTLAAPNVHPLIDVALRNGSNTLVPKVVVQASATATTGYFEAYATSALTGVYDSIVTSDLTSSGGFISETVAFFGAKDLSMGGKPADGYDTDDPIYFSIYVDQPGLIQDLRIRLGVGEGSTPADNPVDFYEHVISANISQALTQGSTEPTDDTSAYDTSLEQAALVNEGISGDYFNQNDQQLQALRFSQLPASSGSGVAVYFDGGISKRQWGKVGRAGTPGFNWLNVTSVTVQGRLANSDVSTVFIMRTGNLFVQGGSGPDTSQPGSVPYDYLYCLRNPKTGAIGPPSPAMVEENFVETVRTSVIVRTKGYVGNTAGKPPIVFAGQGSIFLYRRGGTYTDGLYRLVKEASIGGTTSDDVYITDTVSDVDIVAAATIEFENDAPVTSPLAVAIQGTITAISGGAGLGTKTVTITTTHGDPTLVRVRSLINVGNGSTFEQCAIAVINSSSSTTLNCDIYFQRLHQTSEVIQINAVAEQPCSLACKAFDCLFLSGDTNNPGTIYKSKAGQPENFPTVDATLRTLGRIQVTAPSDPIIQIDEFGGRVLVLTRESLYELTVWNGVLQPAVETPAGRGGVDKRCYAKGDNSVFYLSYDGIYAWSGGQSVKITEDIDWVFRDRTINNISPVDYSLLDFACMAYVRNSLHFVYVGKDGFYYRAIYEAPYNRWTLNIVNNSLGNIDAISAMYKEEDTNVFWLARYNSDGTPSYQFTQDYYSGTVGTTDGNSIANITGTGGTPINFIVGSPAFTAGAPAEQKLITQAVVELANPWADVTVAAYYDFSGVASADTFTIPGEVGIGTISGTTLTRSSGLVFTEEMVGAQVITIGGETRLITAYTSANVVTISSTATLTSAAFYVNRRRRVPLPFGLLSSTATGHECYALGFTFSGSGKIPTTFYSMSFDVAPLAEIQRAKGYDWDDLGYAFDKRLDVLSIEYNMVGQSVTMLLDTITGINGTTQTLGVYTFTLGGSGTGRSKANIPLRKTSDGSQIIAKMIRLRPTQTVANFQIFDYAITHEKYPPDITMFTEPSDYGHPWEKFFDQLVLECDTGNVAASIAIFTDGNASPSQTVSVTTTNNNRMALITLQAGVQGRMARLVITPGSGGKFQLFKHNFIFTPSDKGAVTHSYDWSDCGYVADKRFYHVEIEYEVSATTTLLLRGIGGIGNNQTETAIGSLTLTTGGRKKAQFQFPVNSVYKLVRFLPDTSNPNTVAKLYTPDYKYEPLPFDIVPYTEPSDYGSAFLKYFQQLVIDVDSGGIQASVQIEVDGTVVQTVTLTTTATDRCRTLTLQGSIVGRMARLLNTAGSGGKFQLFSHNLVTLPADKGPSLHSFDWSDAGHPWDKRFYQLTLEYEVLSNMTLVVEGRSGIGNNQTTTTIDTISLTTSGRKEAQFPFPVNSVYKQIRVRPSSGVPPTDARIYQPQFQYEKYPPDIVPYTEPEDCGTPYRKFLQQLNLDVDTNSIAATVQIEVDGTVVQTITGITTNALNRNVQLTLNPSMVGRKVRILNTAGSGGKFQLFGHEFIVLPADRGPVLQSFDWDDLGHPYSKRLKTVTFEAEIEQTSAEMIMDVLGGNLGTTEVLNSQRFTISGPGRVLQTFAIADQTYATMIRFRMASTTVILKTWKYIFDFEKLPQSTTLFTDYDDLGGSCEKILRSLSIDCDTGGAPAQISIDIDGEVRHAFSINTTATDRSRLISLPSDLIGFRFRLLSTPDLTGKFQLFRHQFERILEPCRVGHWDSYEQSYGSNGFKICKQVWLEYLSTCDLTLRFYCDYGVLLWEQPMPKHDKREVFRFFLPQESADTQAYLKSKIYRITVDANVENGWFKLYRDSSRLEILNLSSDQRSAWAQSYLWESMPINY